jgi:hypothetical protein
MKINRRDALKGVAASSLVGGLFGNENVFAKKEKEHPAEMDEYWIVDPSHNVYMDHLLKHKESYDKWRKLGFLNHSTGYNIHPLELSCVFENTDKMVEDGDDARHSFELIAEVFSNTNFSNFVSVQPLYDHHDIKEEEGDKIYDHDHSENNKIFITRYDHEKHDCLKYHLMDYELKERNLNICYKLPKLDEEGISFVASEINLDVTREVITDLREISQKTRRSFNWYELDEHYKVLVSLKYFYGGSREVVTDFEKHDCFWMVTSPEKLAELSQKYEFAETKPKSSFGINYRGTLSNNDGLVKKIKVYTDPLYPIDQILVGAKNQFFSGYVLNLHSIGVVDKSWEMTTSYGNHIEFPNRHIRMRYGRSICDFPKAWYKSYKS